MVRHVDPETVGTNSIPQLRPPRSYALVWADESVRAEKALSIWKPLPPPGCAPQLSHAQQTSQHCLEADALLSRSPSSDLALPIPVTSHVQQLSSMLSASPSRWDLEDLEVRVQTRCLCSVQV